MTPLFLAYLIDLVIGDPRFILHPIVLIGRLISVLENNLRGAQGDKSPCGSLRAEVSFKISLEKQEIILGGILAAIVVGITYISFFIFTIVVNRYCHQEMIFGLTLSGLLQGIIGSFALSTKGLCSYGRDVIDKIDNLAQARTALSRIVGRDTKALDRENILKAVIETLSENASDGIIAPMFYFAIGGLPLAFAYKAVNTLDSMLGYKNERYLYFGRIAARLDDVVNFLPARITGILLIISAYLLRMKYNDLSPLRGFRIMIRDGQRHPSPNAGIPESAVAGIFGIRLGGTSIYGGAAFHKPIIGDDLNVIDVDMILKEISIVKTASFLGILFVGLIFLLQKINWSVII